MLRFFQTIAFVTVVSAATGAASFLLVWSLRDISFVGNVIEQTRDVTLAIDADRVPVRRFTTPIVVVNIDDDTYDKLGRPLPFNREAIAQILSSLRGLRLQAVVVDVDLGWRTNSQDEGYLQKALSAWPPTAAPLLFVREAAGTPYSVRTLATTPFDDVVLERDNIRWVTAHGIASASDQVLRRMETSSRTCVGSRSYLVEGVALAVNGASAPGKINTANWLCPHTGANDASNNAPSIDDIDDYIHFTIRWSETLLFTGQMTRANGVTRPLVSVVSAMPFVSTSEPSIATDLFDGAIVLIGASHSLSKDSHQTPIGPMPGVFVIANHIRGTVEFERDAPKLQDGLLVSIALSVATGIICLLVPWAASACVQLLTPILVTAISWVAFVFLSDGGFYLGLAAVQLISGSVSTLVASWRPIGGVE